MRILERVLRRLEAAARPVVIFDLDGTLYDNRHRTLAIAHELGVRDGWQPLGTMRLADIDYSLEAALRAVGVEQGLAEIQAEWFRRFFHNDYIHHDQPVEGALEFVSHCRSRGAEVIYLTGRDIPTLLEGTAAKLRDDGFPICTPGTQLILKPRFEDDDEDFKRAVLPLMSRYGEVVAFFDNEPGNCNLARELLPGADIVHLDTHYRPDAPPLVEAAAAIGSFSLG